MIKSIKVFTFGQEEPESVIIDHNWPQLDRCIKTGRLIFQLTHIDKNVWLDEVERWREGHPYNLEITELPKEGYYWENGRRRYD